MKESEQPKIISGYEEFRNPDSTYRAAPFWAWNTRLDRKEVIEDVRQFSDMGMGGFHAHTRVGLDTPYMGEEYLERIKASADEAERLGMKLYLYDEDRWPSGFGGGLVTKDKSLRATYLVVTPFKQDPAKAARRIDDSSVNISAARQNGTFLRAFDVELDGDARLVSFTPLGENEPAAHGRKWYVYRETMGDSAWFNDQAYLDTMNKAAVKRFIEVTHERYRAVLGERFGKTITSIFTDEPQTVFKKYLGHAAGERELTLPYTEGMDERYQELYGESLLDLVPELIWERADGRFQRTRYRFIDLVAQLFKEAYSDQLHSWCSKHGLKLTGHMMEEPTLSSQTKVVGDVMRGLSSFEIPGIDILADRRENTTAKQAQSVARQYGREGTMCECYGVTNWDFDFRHHKLEGDWLAALGVTLRVPHLTWMSMEGEAKRDYPASIGRQSPWYKKYNEIEDHLSRVTVALKKGEPVVKIGVVHPLESMWLAYGPADQTDALRDTLDSNFLNVTDWLLYGELDFDYVSESLLPSQANGCSVGKMDYDAIVVPGCLTLRSSTLAWLRSCRDAGKQVIFAGEPAAYVDAEPSCEARDFALTCTCIQLNRSDLLATLAPYRQLSIRFDGTKRLKKPNHHKDWDGLLADKYIYQLRAEGDSRWLFIANGKIEQNPDLVSSDKVIVAVHGTWDVTEIDTATGEPCHLDAWHEEGWTKFRRVLFSQDSVLLHLEPAERLVGSRSEQSLSISSGIASPIASPETLAGLRDLFDVSVKLEPAEPNVLVLDLASWRVDEEPWQPVEELLRIDNRLRDRFGFPLRMASVAQPWTQPNDTDSGSTLCLRFTFESQGPVEGARLAAESLAHKRVRLNGAPVDTAPTGEYVDHAIGTCLLPVICAGVNVLEVEERFTRKTNVENLFVLGNFGVEVRGARATLVPFVADGRFGDVVPQGMPFYGGNLTYRCELDLKPGSYELSATQYRGGALEISVDDGAPISATFSPYRVAFDVAEQGRHVLSLTCYGNRINTFGTLHDCDSTETYYEPNKWRTMADSWAYEYQLKPFGILKAPVLRYLG